MNLQFHSQVKNPRKGSNHYGLHNLIERSCWCNNSNDEIIPRGYSQLIPCEEWIKYPYDIEWYQERINDTNGEYISRRDHHRKSQERYWYADCNHIGKWNHNSIAKPASTRRIEREYGEHLMSSYPSHQVSNSPKCHPTSWLQQQGKCNDNPMTKSATKAATEKPHESLTATNWEMKLQSRDQVRN